MPQRPVFRRFDNGLLAGAAVLALSLSGCADTDSGGTASALDSAPVTAAPTTAASSVASTASGAASEAVAVPSSANTEAAPEQTFASAWGPATGSQIPKLAASDHTGQPQTLASLSGDKGLLLVFSRSADW